jgi:hypothetical protein
VKDTYQSFTEVDEQTFVKLTEHKITFEKILEDLMHIFSRYDLDNDGVLNMEELNNFFLACGSAPLDAEAYIAFLQNHSQNSDSRGLSSTAFLEWQKKELSLSPSEVCRRFFYLGYQPCFHNIHKEQYESLEAAIDDQARWNFELDQTLVEFVNYFWDKVCMFPSYILIPYSMEYHLK